MDSSVFWGVTGLIGGFITSFFFYKLSTKSKKLIYSIKTDTLVTDNISKINGLSILFFNKPITNLSSTTVTFKSTGKDIVEMADFAKASPLYIQTDGEFLLTNNIESTVTNNSNPLNLVKPVMVDSATIALEYDYFSQKDIVTFTFFHTGNLKVTGKIKRGLLINDNLENKRALILDYIIYILSLICFIYAMYIYTWGGHRLDGILSNIMDLGFNLVLCVLVINYIKKVFRNFNSHSTNFYDSTIKTLSIIENNKESK